MKNHMIHKIKVNIFLNINNSFVISPDQLFNLLILEILHLGNLSAFMVTSEDCQSISESNLESNQ
jgi:hypothetical protein